MSSETITHKINNIVYDDSHKKHFPGVEEYKKIEYIFQIGRISVSIFWSAPDIQSKRNLNYKN